MAALRTAPLRVPVPSSPARSRTFLRLQHSDLSPALCVRASPHRQGMGRMATMFKNESQAIGLGIVGICAAGAMMSLTWFGIVSDRKPSTFTPAWKKATVKYRAAQNQDPITNQ